MVNAELDHQRRQAEYFAARVVEGPLLTPLVYQPVIEPIEGALVAVFLELGAAHLVFRDEVAPVAEIDEQYRRARADVFGRTIDIESVEFEGAEALFHGAGAGINLYETSWHFDAREAFAGRLYSSTWNHMLSAGPRRLIELRGGYRPMLPVVRYGSRKDAERWA